MNKSVSNNSSSSIGRRKFLNVVTASVGITALQGSNSKPGIARQPVQRTIQQVIDLILKDIPNAPFSQTVDTIKSGDGQLTVTGIVTTMFATIEVIRKAASAGANFIIAHEPTFYSHTDETQWLTNDPVYKFKQELLDRHKIVVWRFHDYWHTHRPDGVLMGVLTKLGWDKFYNTSNPPLIVHPGIKLDELASHAKKTMGIQQVRVIGNPTQLCKRIALIPGAAGGRAQMQLLGKEKPDVLLVGEVHEWETAEYVRDAQAMGNSMSLIVLGHAVSEEPGMEWLVPWLNARLKDIKVIHVPSNNPFREV